MGTEDAVLVALAQGLGEHALLAFRFALIVGAAALFVELAEGLEAQEQGVPSTKPSPP